MQILTWRNRYKLGIWIKDVLGQGQTSNFSCAEPNANKYNQLEYSLEWDFIEKK
jgi:hypothetical protein